ncbi:MAG: NAD(P)H-quinone oxidoreductase, partial [Burkholderiales bacterium]|nr:NAD(P)H-quinone oxidoreductase [Burkholderiales bacterium]
GGSPYGVTHHALPDGSQMITEEEKIMALAQGKRLAQLVLQLKKP